MRILNKTLICLLLTTIFTCLNADNRILFYLKQVPERVLKGTLLEQAKQNGIKKIEKLSKKTPAQISEKLLKKQIQSNQLPKVSGFLALYSGYSDYSNSDGLISFPLRHIAPKLYLVLTKKINLIKVKGHTISHKEFEISKDVPTKIYMFEKKQDQNKQFFWQVSEQQIPQNKRVNPLSVVILTNPKNIYVTPGDFLSDDSKHLVLPDIYVVGNVDNYQILMNTLDIKRYFEPIEEGEEKVSDVLIKKMITNM